MIRKVVLLTGALTLLWLATPAFATGVCTAGCNDGARFTGSGSTSSDCYPFGTNVCSSHGGLTTLQWQATATCTAGCGDGSQFTGAASGPSDCSPFGTSACSGHGGLVTLLYQP
jgi:hypothetical protein